MEPQDHRIASKSSHFLRRIASFGSAESISSVELPLNEEGYYGSNMIQQRQCALKQTNFQPQKILLWTLELHVLYTVEYIQHKTNWYILVFLNFLLVATNYLHTHVNHTLQCKRSRAGLDKVSH